VSAQAIALAWLAFARGGGKATVGWLIETGIKAAIAAAVVIVLDQLWQEAYKDGFDAASELANRPDARPDPLALRTLLDRLGPKWASEIAQTTIERVAQVLSLQMDEKQLEDEIDSVLDDPSRSEMIVETEVSRGLSSGATAAYGHEEVRWVTGGPDPCPVCLANEADDPRPAGTPFSSGATAPPQHPHCRCALVPA